MANIKYYDVILKPVVTEKSMAAMAEKKYTFLVHPEANKSMIKEAVEKMFEGTKVASVNTMNLDGKNKRRGTGVEMEALTAVSVAALTVYDMCKAVQRDMRIDGIHLLYKEGGKSGVYEAEE